MLVALLGETALVPASASAAADDQVGAAGTPGAPGSDGDPATAGGDGGPR